MRARPLLLQLLTRPDRIWRFARDPRAPRAPKVLLVLAALYTLSPIDLIPDVIPVIGWLDDVGLLSAAIAWFLHVLARWESDAESAELVTSPSTRPRRDG
jgi:uncharacterized membrane protein YkvA (DUF1232 family)